MPKGSDVIARFLDEQGVECVFELVGGMIVHLLDSLHQADRIRIVSMHHEQGAAFAAEGYARVSGVPGVAMATSGPGATNLMTGIASCYFDSTPAVFITGQVNRNEMKGDRAIRSDGLPGDRHRRPGRSDHQGGLAASRRQSNSPSCCSARSSWPAAGARGPVLLDVPMDIQRADVPNVDETHAVEAPVDAPIELSAIEDLIGALGRSERPLVLVGGGVRAGQAIVQVRELLAALGVRRRQLADGCRCPARLERTAGRDDRQLWQPLGEPRDRPVRLPPRPGEPARHPSDGIGDRGVQGAAARSSTSMSTPVPMMSRPT